MPKPGKLAPIGERLGVPACGLRAMIGTAMETLQIKDWHAHVYFDAASARRARALREKIGEELRHRDGPLPRKPVGPHPRFQLSGRLQE